jgi:hypothetical protein
MLGCSAGAVGQKGRYWVSWYLEALKKYAVFGGRSRRKEYWYFVPYEKRGAANRPSKT